ncbi:uncharacterized protein LOC123193182 [Mangifera indica]|uniref:uncharacterized protein LOC123193182 n=1 Tax=Mangifera indica TaxID=29780 RepID=UPI001CF9E3FD|nr:uncharacterized protein LOC123193182 [Mangifera indica]
MAATQKNMGFLVCLLIMALDVTAGILGIEAEIAENKVKHVRVLIFECRESSHKAFRLGLAAVVLLSFAHVIANLLGGCICFGSKAEMNNASPNKQLAVASLIFSWITLAAAFSMLIIGTLSNARPKKSCGLTHHRLFSIGGIVCFIHGLFTVAYYVSAAATAREKNQDLQDILKTLHLSLPFRFPLIFHFVKRSY